MWINLLINIAVFAFKEYAKNTDSSKDDKILEAVQIGAKYLVPKSNNTLTDFENTAIQTIKMRKTQRSR